jgi:cytochrome c oxidase subunit 2
LPAVIIAFTLGYTIFTLRSVAGIGGAGGTTGPAAHADHGAEHGAMVHPQATTADASTLDVRIIGKQWWWEISYPEAQVSTANEIHLPAGVPIRLTVTSDDVIHSFWIPQVAGKVDVIPGRFNTMTIRVDAPGTYRGMCSEFCGLQHARMHLFLTVHPPSDFAAWIASQQQPPAAPTDSLAQNGQQVFQRACAECHAVRGAATAGRSGPDLTHVASRSTLGAGLHENTRANLEGWVSDPQAMKRGNKMPRPELSAADTRAVLAYLELLK